MAGDFSGGNRLGGQDGSPECRRAPKMWRLLSAGEEHSLAERIKIGDTDAEQTLITANLGLVKRAVNDYAHCGVPRR